jgi:RNA 2',3'-cyclic 3'-phosphodiesterase
VRLFVAIDIPEDVRVRLVRFLAQLRPLAKLRWSSGENLHITTKFVGEWPESRLQEIEAALSAIPKQGAIAITIRGLGWFPNPHSPRVFFAGVQAGPQLAALAKDTEQAVAALGVPPEKRERAPHLTLARVGDHGSKESLNAVRQAVARLDSDDFGTFQAVAQHLYLSAGGKYTQLSHFSLSES